MIDKPPRRGDEGAVLEFVKEAAEQGEKLLQHQKGYSEIDKTIKALLGDQKKKKAKGLANYVFNRTDKTNNDVVAGLTDIKPYFSFKTENEKYAHQAQIFNKLTHAGWLKNLWDIKLAMTVQLGMAAGTGYLQPVWNPDMHRGKGDIDFIPRDARDVLPIGATPTLSCQDWQGVDIRSAETCLGLRAMYPEFADRIKPDREIGYKDTIGSSSSAVLKRFMPGQDYKIPGKVLHTVYLHDDTRNEGRSSVWMGLDKEGNKTLWSYEVPPGGYLYPLGRCIVAGEDLVFYDDTSIYWHGKFPLVRFPMDLSFVFENALLSRGGLADILELQDILNELANGILDACRKALRPGVIADSRAVSKNLLDAYDPRIAGSKLRVNPVTGEGIKHTDPPILPPYVFEFLKFVVEQMEVISGSHDLSALLKLRQMPAMESIESIIQGLSPTTRLRGRLMEAGLVELADMLMFNYLEFYNAPRRFSMLGRGGWAFEDFDYDPGNMIPADFPGESRMERAMSFANNFSFYVTPNSMLELSLVSKKAQYIMLAREGKMDTISLLEALEIPNIPQIMERMGGEFEKMIMAMAEMRAGEAGRPPTGQTMPHVEMKGDGRSVLAES